MGKFITNNSLIGRYDRGWSYQDVMFILDNTWLSAGKKCNMTMLEIYESPCMDMHADFFTGIWIRSKIYNWKSLSHFRTT